MCSTAKGSCGFHNGGWAVERTLWKTIPGCFSMLCVLNHGILSLLMHMCEWLSAWTKYLQILVIYACVLFGYFWGLETTRKGVWNGKRVAGSDLGVTWLKSFSPKSTTPVPSCPPAPLPPPVPLLFCSATGINIYAGMWHILDGNTSGCSLFSIHSCHAASYQGAMGLLHLVSTPTPNSF